MVTSTDRSTDDDRVNIEQYALEDGMAEFCKITLEFKSRMQLFEKLT